VEATAKTIAVVKWSLPILFKIALAKVAVFLYQ
jgi:hypothetical protein